MSSVDGALGVSHMSVVITMPPASFSVLPFSRTVIVITVCLVSKPLMLRAAPVFLRSKSTSNSF